MMRVRRASATVALFLSVERPRSVSGVRLERSSFFEIPDPETLDVHPKGPFAEAQRDSFQQQLVLGEDCVAGIARFAVAWSMPERSDAVLRQVTAFKFAPDDATEDFFVHEA
jgi:hypothetical protein